MFLIIGSRSSKCENNLWEVIVCESFTLVSNLTFDPAARSSGGHHTKKGLISPVLFL